MLIAASIHPTPNKENTLLSSSSSPSSPFSYSMGCKRVRAADFFHLYRDDELDLDREEKAFSLAMPALAPAENKSSLRVEENDNVSSLQLEIARMRALETCKRRRTSIILTGSSTGTGALSTQPLPAATAQCTSTPQSKSYSARRRHQKKLRRTREMWAVIESIERFGNTPLEEWRSHLVQTSEKLRTAKIANFSSGEMPAKMSDAIFELDVEAWRAINETTADRLRSFLQHSKSKPVDWWRELLTLGGQSIHLQAATADSAPLRPLGRLWISDKINRRKLPSLVVPSVIIFPYHKHVFSVCRPRGAPPWKWNLTHQHIVYVSKEAVNSVNRILQKNVKKNGKYLRYLFFDVGASDGLIQVLWESDVGAAHSSGYQKSRQGRQANSGFSIRYRAWSFVAHLLSKSYEADLTQEREYQFNARMHNIWGSTPFLRGGVGHDTSLWAAMLPFHCGHMVAESSSELFRGDRGVCGAVVPEEQANSQFFQSRNVWRRPTLSVPSQTSTQEHVAR
eukprot:gb/GEZN01006484.1/.p1 GENE.gb/GEZN01006484.1/~~gb/GEZN01006484.1/.p1  ORF type:complete len:509 (+),score=20.03 gb/GEZN01006484.1/:1-1527(+)